MTTTPAPAEGRVRPRARRAQLPETSSTGLMARVAFAAEHGVTDETVRRWVRDGLPCVYLGGLPFIPLADAREWIMKRGKRR
jgi:hypothetical protein